MATNTNAAKKQLESIERNKARHEAAMRAAASHPPAPSVAGAPASAPSSQQGNMGIMPETKPAARPPEFMPLIDPTRSGQSPLAKVKLPKGTAAGINLGLKVTGLDKIIPIKPDAELELGDFLPGVQEALKPIFAPPSKEEKIEQQQQSGESYKQWQQTGAPGSIPFSAEAIGASIGQGRTIPEIGQGLMSGLQGALLGAQKASSDIMAWGANTNNPLVEGATGTPQAILNMFNLPAQTTEKAFGAAQMGTGFEFNPAQAIIGNQTIPTLAEAARRVGAHGVAEFLVGKEGYDPDKRVVADPGILTNLVANIVARQRMAGQDSTMTENILSTMLKGGELFTGERDPEQIIARQAELVKMSDQGLTPEAWKAGIYAYDGTPFMEEYRQRLESGEDPDAAREEIDQKMGAQSFVQDFAGQMILDPLNVVDVLGGFNKILGRGTRSERWASEILSEFVVQTDEGAGLLRLAENAGDVRYVSPLERKLRNIPGLGFFARPLPETIVSRRGEEASNVIKMMVQGISPQATERLLEHGIDQHPLAMAIQAFVNHDADDLVRGANNLPLSSRDVQDLLGFGARPMTAAEASKMGRPAGVIDLFRSNAADRARQWFGLAGEDSIQKLAEQFDEVQKLYTNTMKSKTFTLVGKAGEETVVKGPEAIELAENKLIKWLEDVNSTYTKAAFPEGKIAGMTPFYEKVSAVRKWMGKIQGPFRVFHMGTNYGMSLRNLGTNKTLGFFDGFNMLTPISQTENEIARLGLGSSGLARSLGGQSDILKVYRGGERSGVKGFLHKIDPMAISQHYEAISGEQVMVQAFERNFSETWRLGNAIPVKGWDEAGQTAGEVIHHAGWAEVSQGLGDRADEALALIEGAHSPGELNTIIPRLTSSDGWRSAAKTALQGTHDTTALADMDKILSEATDQIDGINRLQNYASMGRDQYKDFMERGMVLANTPAADVIDKVQMAVKGLTPKQQADLTNEFTKKLIRQDATTYLYRSYAETAIESLKGIGDDVLRQAGVVPPEGFATYREYLLRKRLDIAEASEEVMSHYRPTQMQATDAILNNDWARLQQVGEEWGRENARRLGEVEFVNPFSGANNRKRGWDSFMTWSNSFWNDYRATQIGDMQSLYDEAASAVEKVKGVRPPPVPEDLIEKFMPLATYEQRQLHANLIAIGRSRGINSTAEMRDILQAAGIPHANNLWQGRIQDRNWFTNAVAAVMDWSKKNGVAAAAEDVADNTDEVAALLNNMGMSLDDVDPTAMNLLEQKAAQLSERDLQIQEVIARLQHPQPPSAIADDAMQGLKDFIRDLEPRHTTVRSVSEQMATKSRDFAFLNYGDNRGIDLVSAMFFNYPKWYFGTLKNTVSRALESPGRLAAILKFRQELRKINYDLPEWYQDQVKIDTNSPLGPLYFNILASLDFTNGFFGDKFRDPDMYQNPLSSLMAESQQFGPGLHGLWASTMAVREALMGNPEGSMGWIGNLGPATRAVTAITALAKEGGIEPLPAGGIVLEPWLWRLEEGQGAQMIGSKYDARRVGLTMGEMVTNGEITPEQAYDAMLSERGPIYDRALNMSKVKSSVSVLMSWLAGAGVKPHPGIEMEVQRMDADRIALMRAKDEGFYEGRPEAWRAAWEKMRETYPFMDFVSGFRRDRVGRANIYAMSVYDRMPPNSRAYIDALMGGEADMYSDLLDKFYGGEPNQKPCSIENMTPPEQEVFMGMMKMLGTVLALPGDAVGKEWNMARQARSAMYTRLNQQYATAGGGQGIVAVQDEYFSILNSEKPGAAEEARQFLDRHGELQSYWNDKDSMIAADPILGKYWASMELYERVAKDEFDAKQMAEHTNLRAELDEYYRQKDIDPEQANAYLDAHPTVTDYWRARDEFMLGIDKEMLGMTQGISNLEGEWGQLRANAQAEMPGQQRVMDLIESGQRPMGSLELPEELKAEQVQAQIGFELRKIQNWNGIYAQLNAMGNLDDTLVAFQKWGRGMKNVPNILANGAELKALLTALSAINEGASGAPGGRISSRTYGGASTAPKSQQKAIQAASDQEIDAFMVSISEQSPLYYGYLTSMAAMTAADIGALFTGNTAFRDWVYATCKKFGISLEALLRYFKRRSTGSSSGKSAVKVISTRVSQPGL
jgi:hypothetical protein